MIEQQMQMSTVDEMPQQDDAVMLRALKQATLIGIAGSERWDISYDRKNDVLSLRRPHRGPSLAYYVPQRQEVVLFVEVETERLVGLDLQCFRQVIAKQHPKLGAAVAAWRRVNSYAGIPGLRTFAVLFGGRAQQALREELRNAADDEFRPPDDPMSPSLRFSPI